MKKKCLAMIAAALLALQLAACGGKTGSSAVASSESASVKEQSSTAQSAVTSKAESEESQKSSAAEPADSSKDETAQSSKAEAAQSSKEEAAPASKEEAALASQQEEAPDSSEEEAVQTDKEQIAQEDAEAEAVFEIGDTEGSSYRNEFFGIAVNGDTGWHFYSESELQELNDSVVDMLNNETAKESLAEGNTYFDMFAENPETIQSMNLTVAKVSAIERVMTTEAILDVVKDTLKEELESQGLSNVSCTRGGSDFLGKEEPSLIIQADGNGFTMFERVVYLRRGAYAGSLTAVSFQEDTTQDILNLFMPVI